MPGSWFPFFLCLQNRKKINETKKVINHGSEMYAGSSILLTLTDCHGIIRLVHWKLTSKQIKCRQRRCLLTFWWTLIHVDALSTSQPSSVILLMMVDYGCDVNMYECPSQFSINIFIVCILFLLQKLMIWYIYS